MNNELCQYHCLYSDRAIVDEEFIMETPLEMHQLDDHMMKSKSAINPTVEVDKIGEGLKMKGL